jgi:hypothetical protein
MSKIKKISESTNIKTMDIVFIHGLNGDSYGTWAGENDSYWPKWLSQEFPEADIWTIGYDASPSKWKNETLSFFKRSQNISEDLKVEGIGSRPVCFICHSLGGLIVKQIIVRSIINTTLSDCTIYDNTRCVVFLATPHRGSSLANLFLKVKMIRTTKLVKYLKCNEDYIEELYYYYRDTPISTLNFYETKGIDVIGTVFVHIKRIPVLNKLLWLIIVIIKKIPVVGVFFNPVVVPENSADCGGKRGAPSPVEKNHFDICKFSNKNDVDYKKIVSFLRDNVCLSNDLSVQSNVDRRVSSKLNALKIEILSSINDANWEKTQQFISEYEGILDDNTHLPNRAEQYFFLAQSEKERVDGLNKFELEAVDYGKVEDLIAKAEQANENS